MPELTLRRTNAAPAPMVCMYCGGPATSAREWREENRRPAAAGGGTDVVPVPAGDDPASAVVALLMLPLVLWQLLVALAAAVGAVAGWASRPASAPRAPAPPKPAPATLVVVTTCERHRRFGDHFVWAGAAMLLPLAALWWWAVAETRRVMGTEDVDVAVTLVVAAILATVLLPVALAAWYFVAGPVVVDRVTESTVVLDRVRQAYFDATGAKPESHAADAA